MPMHWKKETKRQLNVRHSILIAIVIVLSAIRKLRHVVSGLRVIHPRAKESVLQEAGGEIRNKSVPKSVLFATRFHKVTCPKIRLIGFQ